METLIIVLETGAIVLGIVILLTTLIYTWRN